MNNRQQNRSMERVGSKKGIIGEKYSETIRIAPLPPAEELSTYENLYPGATKVLIDAFVKQSEHRMALEQKYMDSQVKSNSRGQLFAFLLGLSNSIAGCLVQILKSDSFIGTAQAISGIVILFGIYLYTDWQRRNELKRKEKIMKD
jgi:uncharacterized membrane protein